MINDIKKIILEVDLPGTRLDKYVSEHCPELSRAQTQKLIRDDEIKVNDQSAKPSLKLNLGDRLMIKLPPSTPNSLLAEDIPLDIIYQDDDLLVIDKPAGMTVHPAPGHQSHTLANAILSYIANPLDSGDQQRPGIVHRLDKDTSGIILVARNNAAYLNLSAQFKSRSVSKTYLALVKGKLTPKDGVIEAHIGRDSAHRERMAVVTEEKGRQAMTNYHVIDYYGDYSLLEIKPETGRTHQIRVHLKAIGHMVVGDKTYGVKSTHLSRQFLHASRIGFKLPSSGEYIEFEAKLPEDLERALGEIGWNIEGKGGRMGNNDSPK